jgi:hypothetical protein
MTEKHFNNNIAPVRSRGGSLVFNKALRVQHTKRRTVASLFECVPAQVVIQETLRVVTSNFNAGSRSYCNIE